MPPRNPGYIPRRGPRPAHSIGLYRTRNLYPRKRIRPPYSYTTATPPSPEQAPAASYFVYPDLVVELGTTPTTAGEFFVLDDTTRGILDGIYVLGPDAFYEDISSYVIAAEVHTPTRQRLLQEFAAGGATLLLNNQAGHFTPQNTGSDYYPSIITGRPVRISARWPHSTGTLYPLLEGFTDSFVPHFPGARQATCTMTVVDGFKLLGGINREAIAAVGASETAATRATRILDACRWPNDKRNLAGSTTLQATTLDGNVLQELNLVAASEGGSLFIDRTGRLTLTARQDIVTATRSLVNQLVIADGNTSFADVNYTQDPGYILDDDTVVNQVNLSRAGGTVQTVEDVAAQALYTNGIARAAGRTDLLLETDAEVLDFAGWQLSFQANPVLRSDQVTFTGMNATSMWATILGLRIFDRVRLRKHPPQGDIINGNYFIQGLTHRTAVDSDGKAYWFVDAQLVSSDPFEEFFILDDTEHGVLDRNVLAY